MSRRRRLRALGSFVAVVALGAAVPVALNVADAAGPGGCSANYQVDEVMANDARWQFCWEIRSREGMVLHHVRFTPSGGTPVEILGQAALAEIHVPYDTGNPRFFDLSGMGVGRYMVDLDQAECPDGALLDNGANEDVVCRQTLPNSYAYKQEQPGAHAQSTSLRFFSVTEMGAYNYIVAWNFDDDGTIRPEVGSTGALQTIGGPRSATWPVGQGQSRRAVAHMHNFYWRLDFDIDRTPNNDRVEEMEALPANRRRQLRNTRRAFKVEVARRVAPNGFRSWRIRDLVARNADNHFLSVELLPDTDHVYRGPPSEPFTHRELYVTKRRPCELMAAGNVGPTCGDDVSEFVDGQSLVNQDLVVWYGTSFHHLPRDEDDPHMHPHWSGFSIVPRDLTATNPAVP